MTADSIIDVIGYASGIGANNPDCSLGPLHMHNSPLLKRLPLELKWQDTLYSSSHESGLKALPAIAEISTRLAKQISQLAQNQNNILVIGGDHNSAIGTWSGVYHAIRTQGNLGLIWIDAHMDSHTPVTSFTGNIHGMPLATLLGFGAPELCDILTKEAKVKPDQVCLIGVRSFEHGEAQLLKKLGVRIFFMDEIKQRGLHAVMQEAIAIASHNTVGFGVSIDLDAIDPHDAPGVGSPVQDGINAQEFLTSLTQLRENPNLLGVEIAEFNPNLDRQQKTEQLICDIIETIFSNKK